MFADNFTTETQRTQRLRRETNQDAARSLESLGYLARHPLNCGNRFHCESFCAQLQFAPKEMIDVTRLLPKLLRAHGGNPELAVKLVWARAAGVGLRRHAIPFRLEGNTLIVSVADAIWQKQLQQMSAELIFRMNNLLGQTTVDALVFRVDPAAVSEAQATSRPRRAKRVEGGAIPTELLFAAGSIADEELRARFMRAAENCIKRRDSHADAPQSEINSPKSEI
jgi:hypothetical protein